MPDLTAADVAAYTGGRLIDDGGDGPVTAMLQAALAAARGVCGWHVSPVRRETITIDGPGRAELFLPSMRIHTVHQVVENGRAVPADQWVVSAGIPGLIVRRSGSWTAEYAGIAVDVEHGYSETEAADWRRAVCQIVDRMSTQPITHDGRSLQEVTRKRVDDVDYQWSDGQLQELAERQAHSAEAVLARYRILPVR